MILGLIGGAIGYAIDGFFWGAIIGIFAGMVISLIVDGARSGKSKPPTVRVLQPQADPESREGPSRLVPTTASKIAELRDLLNRDFITLEEFEAKRKRLLDDL
jgi:hypothetical protein